MIGVIGDEHADGLQEKAPPIAYYPILMNNFDAAPVATRRTVAYVIRSTRAGSQSLLGDVQHAVWSVNTGLPLARVRTLKEIYSKSMERTAFALVMLTIAGAMALLIGMVGLWGAISYAVSQRRREIGIRMALGARHRETAGIFIVNGLVLAVVGLALGLAVSAVLTRVLRSLLFGVTPLDPLTYTAVSLGLIVAAVAASYIPARRAMQIDPLEALRCD